MKAISENGDLYVTKRGAYIRIFRATKFPYLLNKLILDKFFSLTSFFLISLSKFFCWYFSMLMPIIFLAMVQVEPNMYFSDLSSSSEGSLGRLEESETSSRYTRAISTRCQKIRRKFYKRMECFLTERGVMFL